MIVHGTRLFYVFIAKATTNNEGKEQKNRVLGISWIGGIVATYLGHK